jgi:hypothetical protein
MYGPLNVKFPAGYLMCDQVQNLKFYVLPTQCIYICVLCGSENKQRLFPYTAVTDWIVRYNRGGMCLLCGTS